MSAVHSRLAYIWFIISSILVIWDAFYCLLRPHTMEGGILHWPLYAPYKLYGEVDHIYGIQAYEQHNGFTSAQALLNLFEVALQIWFLRLRKQAGEEGNALMVGYTASVMTFWKTALYMLQEYYSGCKETGHNPLDRLFFLWIIPNGIWLVFPAILIKRFGSEILEGLNKRGSKQA